MDDLYNELTSGNVSHDISNLYLKDTLLFVLSSNRNKFDLNIKNITNTKYGLYKLTKEYNIKPFNYQLENVNWCKNIEKCTPIS